MKHKLEEGQKIKNQLVEKLMMTMFPENRKT